MPTVDDVLSVFRSTFAFLQGQFAVYAPILLGVALVACATAVVVLVIRAVRGGRLDNAATWVAIVTATAFSAEGMWEVAREGLGLSVWQSIGLFAAAEAAMTACAVRARRRHKAGQHPGPDGAAVWIIALAAGCTAALNADSAVEIPVRIGVPLLAAGLWWLELTDHGLAPKPADAITWRITPRRVLVWLRLAQPGRQDLTEFNAERRIAALTIAAYRVHNGWHRLRRLRAWQLRRLALAADSQMISAVRDQMIRVHTIETLTDPTTHTATYSAAPVATTTADPRPPHGVAVDQATRPGPVQPPASTSSSTRASAWPSIGASAGPSTGVGHPPRLDARMDGAVDAAVDAPPVEQIPGQTSIPVANRPVAASKSTRQPVQLTVGRRELAGRDGAPRDRARAAALRHQDRTGELPTVSALMELADVARGTAGNALRDIRDEAADQNGSELRRDHYGLHVVNGANEVVVDPSEASSDRSGQQ